MVVGSCWQRCANAEGWKRPTAWWTSTAAAVAPVVVAAAGPLAGSAGPPRAGAAASRYSGC